MNIEKSVRHFNPEKNPNISVNYLYEHPYSHQKIWWKCEKGHEWQSTISSKVTMELNCPMCSGKTASPENNLLAKYPEVCKEWDYSKNRNNPEAYLPKSYKKVWWKCEKGHEFEIRIIYKTHDQIKCPGCFGKRANKYRNLKIMYPEICKEWDYEENKTRPEEYTHYSNKKVWWKCEKGHKWQSLIGSRVHQRSLCPFCSKKIPTKLYNLLEVSPALSEEWDYEENKTRPEEYLPSSGKKVWWKCKKDSSHKWLAVISNRRKNKTGCPQCFFVANGLETSFINLMKDVFPNIEKFDKPILDKLYKPDFKLEHNGKILYVNVDGLYWHSEHRKPKWHHFEMRRYFNHNKIDIIQLYEDEVRDKPEIVKSIVLSKLGMIDDRIYARECVVKKVSLQDSNMFLDNNHLMGSTRGYKCLGLYYNNELVSLMSFKTFLNDKYIEISRFCSKLNTIVIGGFSKLLAQVKAYGLVGEISKIVSFCDLRYGIGVSYETMSFERVNESLGWYWTDGNERFNRLMCKAGNGNTEADNAIEKGWYKIYDAGQAKYVLEM